MIATYQGKPYSQFTSSRRREDSAGHTRKLDRLVRGVCALSHRNEAAKLLNYERDPGPDSERFGLFFFLSLGNADELCTCPGCFLHLRTSGLIHVNGRDGRAAYIENVEL